MKPRSWLAIAVVLAGGAIAGHGANSAAKEQTVQGCLSVAASEYILSGSGPGYKQYHLTGDTAALATHVGHTIAVTGDIVVPARSTWGASDFERNGGWKATGADASLYTGTLQMKSFRDVAGDCGSK